MDWPGPGAEPAGSPLAKVREELVQQAGVARRLDRSFATRPEATQVAKAFVEHADPGRYVPGASGRFEAMVVRNDDQNCWHVVVRFVPEGPAAAFLDAVEWFEGWLAPIVRRPLKAGTYWCGQWQEHAEAVERVTALWEAWEAARAEGGNAMSYWWTVHFDAHWAALGGLGYRALLGVREEGPAQYRPPGTSERLRRGRGVRARALRRPTTVPELWWRSAVPKNEFPLFRKAFR